MSGPWSQLVRLLKAHQTGFQALPRIGRIVTNDEAAYRYLVESIRTFPTQQELADMFSQAGFVQVRVRNLSSGIAAIHSGWKLD